MSKKIVPVKATAKTPQTKGKPERRMADDARPDRSTAESTRGDHRGVDIPVAGRTPSLDEETLSDAAPYNKTYGVKHERQ
jgi:hypothetical protein